MSLRKSPTLTPASLASRRRNAKKSTGPKTAHGKAWSRMNSLRHGGRSWAYTNFFQALVNAPPGRVGETAQTLLEYHQLRHPLFLEAAEVSVEAEIAICEESRMRRMRGK